MIHPYQLLHTESVVKHSTFDLYSDQIVTLFFTIILWLSECWQSISISHGNLIQFSMSLLSLVQCSSTRWRRNYYKLNNNKSSDCEMVHVWNLISDLHQSTLTCYENECVVECIYPYVNTTLVDCINDESQLCTHLLFEIFDASDLSCRCPWISA